MFGSMSKHQIPSFNLYSTEQYNVIFRPHVESASQLNFGRHSHCDSQQQQNYAAQMGVESSHHHRPKYDRITARMRAAVKWLLCKAFDHRIPDEFLPPFYKDDQRHDRLKPAVVHRLANGELYRMALAAMYGDPASYQHLNHRSLILFLTRKGFALDELATAIEAAHGGGGGCLSTENVGVAGADSHLSPPPTAPSQLMTETSLMQTTPLKMNSHLTLIEALMALHVRECVPVDRIRACIDRFREADLLLSDADLASEVDSDHLVTSPVFHLVAGDGGIVAKHARPSPIDHLLAWQSACAIALARRMQRRITRRPASAIGRQSHQNQRRDAAKISADGRRGSGSSVELATVVQTDVAGAKSGVGLASVLAAYCPSRFQTHQVHLDDKLLAAQSLTSSSSTTPGVNNGDVRDQAVQSEAVANVQLALHFIYTYLVSGAATPERTNSDTTSSTVNDWDNGGLVKSCQGYGDSNINATCSASSSTASTFHAKLAAECQMYVSLDDIVYCHPSLHLAIVCFTADLFATLEIRCHGWSLFRDALPGVVRPSVIQVAINGHQRDQVAATGTTRLVQSAPLNATAGRVSNGHCLRAHHQHQQQTQHHHSPPHSSLDDDSEIELSRDQNSTTDITSSDAAATAATSTADMFKRMSVGMSTATGSASAMAASTSTSAASRQLWSAEMTPNRAAMMTKLKNSRQSEEFNFGAFGGSADSGRGNDDADGDFRSQQQQGAIASHNIDDTHRRNEALTTVARDNHHQSPFSSSTISSRNNSNNMFHAPDTMSSFADLRMRRGRDLFHNSSVADKLLTPPTPAFNAVTAGTDAEINKSSNVGSVQQLASVRQKLEERRKRIEEERLKVNTIMNSDDCGGNSPDFHVVTAAAPSLYPPDNLSRIRQADSRFNSLADCDATSHYQFNSLATASSDHSMVAAAAPVPPPAPPSHDSLLLQLGSESCHYRRLQHGRPEAHDQFSLSPPPPPPSHSTAVASTATTPQTRPPRRTWHTGTSPAQSNYLMLTGPYGTVAAPTPNQFAPFMLHGASSSAAGVPATAFAMATTDNYPFGSNSGAISPPSSSSFAGIGGGSSASVAAANLARVYELPSSRGQTPHLLSQTGSINCGGDATDADTQRSLSTDDDHGDSMLAATSSSPPRRMSATKRHALLRSRSPHTSDHAPPSTCTGIGTRTNITTTITYSPSKLNQDAQQSPQPVTEERKAAEAFVISFDDKNHHGNNASRGKIVTGHDQNREINSQQQSCTIAARPTTSPTPPLMRQDDGSVDPSATLPTTPLNVGATKCSVRSTTTTDRPRKLDLSRLLQGNTPLSRDATASSGIDSHRSKSPFKSRVILNSDAMPDTLVGGMAVPLADAANAVDDSGAHSQSSTNSSPACGRVGSSHGGDFGDSNDGNHGDVCSVSPAVSNTTAADIECSNEARERMRRKQERIMMNAVRRRQRTEEARQRNEEANRERRAQECVVKDDRARRKEEMRAKREAILRLHRTRNDIANGIISSDGAPFRENVSHRQTSGSGVGYRRLTSSCSTQALHSASSTQLDLSCSGSGGGAGGGRHNSSNSATPNLPPVAGLTRLRAHGRKVQTTARPRTIHGLDALMLPTPSSSSDKLTAAVDRRIRQASGPDSTAPTAATVFNVDAFDSSSRVTTPDGASSSANTDDEDGLCRYHRQSPPLIRPSRLDRFTDVLPVASATRVQRSTSQPQLDAAAGAMAAISSSAMPLPLSEQQHHRATPAGPPSTVSGASGTSSTLASMRGVPRHAAARAAASHRSQSSNRIGSSGSGSDGLTAMRRYGSRLGRSDLRGSRESINSGLTYCIRRGSSNTSLQHDATPRGSVRTSAATMAGRGGFVAATNTVSAPSAAADHYYYDDGASEISSTASGFSSTNMLLRRMSGGGASVPRLYREPTVKSNRPILVNALEHVVFAGAVNEMTRARVLDALDRASDAGVVHFLVLFRDAKCQFRGLYAHINTASPATASTSADVDGHESDTIATAGPRVDGDVVIVERIVKLYGAGPRLVTDDMFDMFFKYNSSGKKFARIHTRHVTATIDAFSIHNGLWLAGRQRAANQQQQQQQQTMRSAC